jgi:DNA-binding MarR family transcriptional regulator
VSKTNFEVDFETSIGPWLGRTVKLVDYHVQEAFDRVGIDLTKEQMIVLMTLRDQDGVNQNELASLTYRDKSSLARLLSKMENKNYISRSQSEEDKRNNQVFITSDGVAIFNRVKPVIQEIIDTMEYGISEKEKVQMISNLKRIQNNFQTKLVSK